jgi:hypothetical protein
MRFYRSHLLFCRLDVSLGRSSTTSLQGRVPLRRRETTFSNQFAAESDASWVVNKKNRNGCTADRSPADEDGTVPTEMPRPTLPPRMKKARNPSSPRIDPGQVRTFVMIAHETRKREIAGNGLSSVLAGHDVFDLKGKLIEHLRHLAVFAAIPSAGTH